MKKVFAAFLFLFFINGVAFANVNVVTTTFLLSSLTKQIGGEYVNCSYLIDVGSNPHIFSPRPKSLMKLAKADLFIGVGFGFEFWIASVREFLKNKDVIFLSDYYKNPIDKRVIGNSTIANPHIWLDLNFMGNVAVFKIADRLCSIDSLHCKYFKYNAAILSNRIRHIKYTYEKTLAKYEKYCFVDIKPAFEYLLKSVNVKSCCVLVKKGSEEPSIGDIRDAVDKCRCKHGVVLYISNSQLATMIAEKLGYVAVSLNPLGDKLKLNTYTKLLMYDLHKLKEALR